jgi:SPP1 gp7 family putative phage head morphogenesis protein
MLNTFQDNWNDLTPSLKEQIAVELDNGSTPFQAVSTVFKRNGLSDKLKLWISEACVAAAEKGGVQFTSNLVGRHFFLAESFAPDKITLSQRVTRLEFQDDVVSTIQANLKAQEQFGRLVSKISQYSTEEDLPKGLRELERQARKVMAGDVEAFNDFAKVLKHEKAVALRAIDGGNETPLKRSYLRLTNAAEKLNEDGLNAAIENAVEQKARSAAFRIADTEVARAYGTAVRTKADQDSECTGIQWSISSSERVCDDCEELDGKIFAKDDLPQYPLHPHCQCILDLFYGDVSELEDHDMETDDSTIPDDILMNDEREYEREAA